MFGYIHDSTQLSERCHGPVLKGGLAKLPLSPLNCATLEMCGKTGPTSITAGGSKTALSTIVPDLTEQNALNCRREEKNQAWPHLHKLRHCLCCAMKSGLRETCRKGLRICSK